MFYLQGQTWGLALEYLKRENGGKNPCSNSKEYKYLAQWFKSPLGMPVSHISWLLQVPATLLLILAWLPANCPSTQAVGDVSSTRVLLTHIGDTNGIPGSWL